MELCPRCGKKTSDPSVTTCEANTSVRYPGGGVLQPVPYDPGKHHLPKWFRCPDCNVAPGANHHANCDEEYCPKCAGQLISCSCFDQTV